MPDLGWLPIDSAIDRAAGEIRILRRGSGSVRAPRPGQLLVLLDGIEERGQVFALATTNRPDSIDSMATSS